MLHLFKNLEGHLPGSLHELRTSKSLAELNAITADLVTTSGSGATGGLSASAYFDRITTDQFTGESFGYRLGDDGPILYSFSENAEDNGGNHSPGWDDKVTDAGDPDDFVFWPPQIRPRRK